MKIGVILETFQSAGNTPEAKDALKTQERGKQMELAHCFNKIAEIPSGPEAVAGLNLLIACHTSTEAHSSSASVVGGSGGMVTGVSEQGAIELKQDTKKSLNNEERLVQQA